MPIKYEYGVYNAENELIFKGDVKAIEDEFDICRSMVWRCVNNGVRLRRKYFVKMLGICEVPKVDKKTQKQKKEENYIDYLVKHLNEYGNVYSRENPEKYLK